MHSGRPDKPLVVKCTFNERWNKRITFSSARNCTFDLLRAKVEQCFSLYATAYAIAYKDDDGEVTTITTDYDLTEAIQYFQAGTDDASMSSAASILSGRSFGSRKITLRVDITVDYDGPSLSDTSSLASLEEYKGRNGSEFSLSLTNSAPAEPDDDSITVSSRDTGAGPSEGGDKLRPGRERSEDSSRSQHTPRPPLRYGGLDDNDASGSRLQSDVNGGYAPSSSQQDPSSDRYGSASTRFPENPSAVFERLKLEEAAQEEASDFESEARIIGTDRGNAWLRDQNARTIKAMLGALPEPSDLDSASVSQEFDRLSEDIGGDLALQRDNRGKYYYSYTSGSSGASQSHDSGYEDGVQIIDEPEASVEAGSSLDLPESKPRVNSMQLNWLQSQQVYPAEVHHPHRSSSEPSVGRPDVRSELAPSPQYPHADIPPEVLQYVTLTGPPQEILTDCSACGVLLDSIRYVCATCGEKQPVHTRGDEASQGKGKGIASATTQAQVQRDPMGYPPLQHRSSSSETGSGSGSGSGSLTALNVSSSPTLSTIKTPSKPLPALPTSPPSSNGSDRGPSATGFELCSGCIESAGVDHALEVNLSMGSSPSPGGNSPSASSPEDAQRLSQWRRTAPGKGKLRHGYWEKVWGHKGWEDVEQEDLHNCKCSTCNTVITHRRYKCASCQKFNLCRACYSQVHEIHPSHAFLVVPDKPVRSRSEPELPPAIVVEDAMDEQSMTHPGVKCAHCMLDIVGARFHCAVCESIDICSNCESAGLPGNLDSSDGGHNSSHIMIKIPRPLETTELQLASRRAMNLWTNKDAASVQRGARRSRPSSVISSHARTVIGTDHTERSGDAASDDHHLHCSGCGHPIVGVRYQCASCPSAPQSYNLCSHCEPKSYLIHDPMHVFFKVPRPVQRPLESAYPMLPRLYKAPVASGRPHNPADPKDYLKTVWHSSALCDRCMERIEGEWFRCAYCAKDLCDACEALDTHNDKHIFLVFKAPVDMSLFRHFADLDNPNGSPPVIPYAVYR